MSSFIEGEKNPADIASRPISYHKFVNCELWWTGPPNNCAKPVCDIVSEIPAESLIELRKKSPAQIAVKIMILWLIMYFQKMFKVKLFLCHATDHHKIQRWKQDFPENHLFDNFIVWHECSLS